MTTEQDLRDKIERLEGENLTLRLGEADKIRQARKDMWQMILNFLNPALIALIGYFNYHSNSVLDAKLDRADENRTRIEEKIDETRETNKTAVIEARTAAERAAITAEHVKTAVAELKGSMDK
jgi:hypothetical protein